MKQDQRWESRHEGMSDSDKIKEEYGAEDKVVGKEIWTSYGAEEMCWRRDTIKGEGTQLEKKNNKKEAISKKQRKTHKKKNRVNKRREEEERGGAKLAGKGTSTKFFLSSFFIYLFLYKSFLLCTLFLNLRIMMNIMFS